MSSDTIRKAYYPFIREAIRVGAWVYPNGRQVLRIEQINTETEEILQFDQLDCIHTAVQDISIEDYNDGDLSKDLYEDLLRARADGEVRIINLEPEEKFKAFKSWVAGIAEAGVEAFELQTEIEMANEFAYPITNILLNFLMKVDNKFMQMYLLKTEQDSMFHGVRHEAFLIAKLLPVCNMLLMDLVQYQHLRDEGKQVLAMIIDMDPPEDLFIKNLNYCFLLAYQWEYYAKLIAIHQDIPLKMSLLLISYGSQREFVQFSIYSLNEQQNPFFIGLNQFKRNMNLDDPQQLQVLMTQFNAATTALLEIKGHLTDSEYESLKTMLVRWKKETFPSHSSKIEYK
jgi:hypothetical protein